MKKLTILFFSIATTAYAQLTPGTIPVAITPLPGFTSSLSNSIISIVSGTNVVINGAVTPNSIFLNGSNILDIITTYGGGIPSLAPFIPNGNDVDLPGQFSANSILVDTLNIGNLFVTNPIVTTNLTVQIMTNTDLSVGTIHATGSGQRLIGLTIGTGLTNNGGTLSNNIVAGSGITITKGANGQLTVGVSGGSAPDLHPPVVNLADGVTVTITCDANKVYEHNSVTIFGNRTLAISGATSGTTGILYVYQGAPGNRTLTLPAGSKVGNSGAGAITLSTTSGAMDALTWVYNGTNFVWNAPQLNYN